MRHRYRKISNHLATADLVDRRFRRDEPDQLWVTDITEHPTREGKVSCAVALDGFNRRLVGWSIDLRPQLSLATDALAMTIENREPGGLRSVPDVRCVAYPTLVVSPTRHNSATGTQ